jgi:Fe-S cluster biogenesis protein NfuA
MAIFGLRDKIKRTVNTIVGKPIAGRPQPPQRPKPSPVQARKPAAAAPKTTPFAPSQPAAAVAPPPVAEPAAAVEAPPVAAPPVEAATEAPPSPSTPKTVDPTDDTAGGPLLTHDEVWELLDDMVRPALQGDGGDIELLKVEENDVHVKLTGACSTCPSSIMTMKMGVEALLREEFPHMRELIQHDA